MSITEQPTGITRRASLQAAIAAFCAAPIARLKAQNGGQINATRFSDLVVSKDIECDLTAPALPAAERLALKIIATYGAVSSDDGFYKATTEFAAEHFGHGDAMDRLEAAIEAINPYLPADQHQAFELRDAINCAANDVEMARWQAMWLLGVCVGVRLGGGGR